MWTFLKRRRTALVVSTVTAMALGGVAYAYFSSTGAGTGTATVGSSSNVVLHATTTGPLYPGGSTPVTFTVDNPGTGSERVNTIHLASVTADGTHTACTVADFTMPDVTVAASFAHGNGQTVTPTGTLSMANTAVSQDACQGATLTLNVTSN